MTSFKHTVVPVIKKKPLLFSETRRHEIFQILNLFVTETYKEL